MLEPQSRKVEAQENKLIGYGIDEHKLLRGNEDGALATNKLEDRNEIS